MSDKNKATLKKLPFSTTRVLTSSQVITSVHSVVKELIENSLDACAKKIEVKLIDSGLSKIEVRDDGIGVSTQDVLVMAKPQYTSKISCEDDIGNCVTYGFRGEALGALCAVSEVTITTKTSLDDVSFVYVLDSTGTVINQKPSSLGQGTTICSQNLFKNLPVRRLMWNSGKRKKDDLKKCEDLIKIFSVIHPDVGFSLTNENCLLWQKTPVTDVRAALVQAWGISILQQMEDHVLQDHRTGIKLLAYLPKPTASCQAVSKKLADSCWIAVNKKPVKQREIIKLLYQGFSSQWGNQGKGRYPICFISLTLIPQLIDVNLEPNKDKVMFINKESVEDLITRLLDKAYRNNKGESDFLENNVNKVHSQNIPSGDKEPFKASGISMCNKTSDFETSTLSVRDECDDIDNNRHNSPVLRTLSQHKDSTENEQHVVSENVTSTVDRGFGSNICGSLIDSDDDDFMIIPDYKIFVETKSSNDKPNDGISSNSTSSLSNNKLSPDDNPNTVENRSNTPDHARDSNLDKNVSGECFRQLDTVNNKMNLVNTNTTAPGCTEKYLPKNREKDFPGLSSEKNCVAPVPSFLVGDHEDKDNPTSNTCNQISFQDIDRLITTQNVTVPTSKDVVGSTNSKAAVEGLHEVSSEKWTLGHLTSSAGKIIEPVKLVSGEMGLKEKRHSPCQNNNQANPRKKLRLDSRQTKLDHIIASQIVKKPRSPFAYFCKEHRASVVAANSTLRHSEITDILVKMFDQLDPKKKEEYKRMAEENVLSDKTSMENKSKVQTSPSKPSKTASNKKKPEIVRKEVVVQFALDVLKDCVSKIAPSPTPACFLSLVGQLKNCGSWIGLQDGRNLVAFNHFRMKEALLYSKLKNTYQFKTQPLLTPVSVNERSIGCAQLFRILLSLQTDKVNPFGHLCITDTRITANGFSICRTTDGDKVEITDINQDLPYYGISDLKEVLQAIQSGLTSFELCRPKKVQHFLQGEAVRMVRQLPSKLTEPEMRELLQSCLSLPANCQICVHSKPFTQLISNVNLEL